MIKVSGLSHNRAKQIDPRLSWLMFHRIYCIYSDIKKKEDINSSMLLTSMSEHEEANKFNEELKDSRDKDDNNQPILQKTIIPYDLNCIQLRAPQVWNCNEVGFDPNGILIKFICAYIFFNVNKCEKCKLNNEHHSGAL